MQPSWVDNEPGWSWARAEFLKMVRRAIRLWPITLGVAVLLSAGVAIKRIRTPMYFEASMVLEVSEAQLHGGDTNPAPRALVDFLYGVVFSNHALAPIMEKYDLQANFRSFDFPFAANQVRDAIGAEVITESLGMATDEGRSTRLVLSYRDKSREGSHKVLRELADLVMQESVAGLRQSTTVAREVYTDATGELNDRLGHTQFEVAQIKHEIEMARPSERAALIIKLRTAMETERALEAKIDLVSSRESIFEMETGATGQGAGYEFRYVDMGRVPPPPALSKSDQVQLLALLGFLLGLPIGTLVAGSIDRRLRDSAGIVSMSLDPIGATQRFVGYDATSLSARMRLAERTS